jgi:xanthine/uracil permease
LKRQGRQDLIAIVCAFVGAGVVRRGVPPVEGMPAVVMSIVGAAIGLMLARAVFKMMNDKEAARAALKQADASKDQNEADPAAALFDDENDRGDKA